MERVHKDGRIYPSWRQIGAATGRMSCSAPNIQQTLKEGALRHYIRAPEGRVLIAADYSQAELRILAQASGEPALIEAFRAGKDPYKATAAGMFGIPETEVSGEQRSVAKGINLSIIYGKMAQGLAEDLDTNVRGARAHMNRYFDAHPKVRAYLEQTSTEALTAYCRGSGPITLQHEQLLGRPQTKGCLLSRKRDVKGSGGAPSP